MRCAYSATCPSRRADAPSRGDIGREEQCAACRRCARGLHCGIGSRCPQSILVTGGAGYVGSHACKALATRRLSSRSSSTICRAAIARRCAGARWSKATSPTAPRLSQRSTQHQVGRRDAFRRLRLCRRIGRRSGALLPQQCRRHPGAAGGDARGRVGTIVFSSTCATYGIPGQSRSRETTPQRPVNPYGETKLAIERALHWYGRRLWDALGRAALFQRRRRRSRRRDRREARPRDASDPAGVCGRARPGPADRAFSAPTIRPPTAPRSATTSMSTISPTPMSARWSYLDAGRRQRRAQSRHRPRPFGARGDSPRSSASAAAPMPRARGRRAGPATRRRWSPTPASPQSCSAGERAFGPRHDRPHRAGLARAATRRRRIRRRNGRRPFACIARYASAAPDCGSAAVQDIPGASDMTMVETDRGCDAPRAGCRRRRRAVRPSASGQVLLRRREASISSKA